MRDESISRRRFTRTFVGGICSASALLAGCLGDGGEETVELIVLESAVLRNVSEESAEVELTIRERGDVLLDATYGLDAGGTISLGGDDFSGDPWDDPTSVFTFEATVPAMDLAVSMDSTDVRDAVLEAEDEGDLREREPLAYQVTTYLGPRIGAREIEDVRIEASVPAIGFSHNHHSE